jgi:hypothetical protein
MYYQSNTTQKKERKKEKKLGSSIKEWRLLCSSIQWWGQFLWYALIQTSHLENKRKIRELTKTASSKLKNIEKSRRRFLRRSSRHGMGLVQVVSGSFVWLLSNMRDLESNDLRLERLFIGAKEQRFGTKLRPNAERAGRVYYALQLKVRIFKYFRNGFILEVIYVDGI